MTERLKGLTVREIRDLARQEADRVRSAHWGALLPIDPVYIARSLGVSVFSAQLGEDVWGMLVGSPNGADIYLDREQPPARFRFSCAHELGHFVERGGQRSEEAFVDKRTDTDRGRADEIFANEFAGSLLMPEADLKRAIFERFDDFDLANMFDVSLDAVRYRRRLLGI